MRTIININKTNNIELTTNYRRTVLINEVKIDITNDVIKRFSKYFLANKETGCWEWQRGIGNNRYGSFSFKGFRLTAHRASYLLFNGDFDDFNPLITHSCDNNICVNPAHLIAGTKKQNSAYMKDRCLATHPFLSEAFNSGENNGRSKLKNIDAILIRKLYKNLNLTQREIGKMFSVTDSSICHIVNYKTFKGINSDTYINMGTDFYTTAFRRILDRTFHPENLDDPGPCWEWKRELKSTYPQIMVKSIRSNAHVMMWMATNRSQIPAGCIVRHTCHNERCCSPHHLIIGTVKDNANDALVRGTLLGNTIGEKHGNAKLTNIEAHYIRESYANGYQTIIELSENYNVHPATIKRVIKRETYSNVK